MINAGHPVNDNDSDGDPRDFIKDVIRSLTRTRERALDTVFYLSCLANLSYRSSEYETCLDEEVARVIELLCDPCDTEEGGK